jgi:4,5-dihydroxyphthalate decarboxylase
MAKKLELSFACGDYEITRPLAEGAVKPDGIDLTVLTGAGSRERHWRMARGNEYDVCEFNSCAYFMARDRGVSWTAIPVFTHRRFRHGFVFINTTKGIKSPADLIGRKVGGTNFQPAGNIWARGILEEFFGVPHKKLIWITERPEDIEFTPPPGLKIEMIPRGKSLDDMLVEGELDAMISPSFPRPFLKGDKRIARLFPNYKQVEADYFRATGIFPIMHVTVIRRELSTSTPGSPRVSFKPLTRPSAWPTSGCATRASCRWRGSAPPGKSRMKFWGAIRGFTASAPPTARISKPRFATLTSRG